MSEKRRLLNFVLSNSSWKDGRLIPGYRKPFDLLAVTNLAYQKEKALSPAKDGLFDIWLPGQALGDTPDLHTFFDSYLIFNTPTSTLPSSPSYGTVHVDLNSAGDSAIVTITLVESPVDVEFAQIFSILNLKWAAFLNVVGDRGYDKDFDFHFIGTGFVNGLDQDLSGVGLGTFDVSALTYNADMESVVFRLYALNGFSWTDAAHVLELNSAGFDAAAYVYQEDGPGIGYAGEVPLPGALLLLGSGLLPLGIYRRRKFASRS